MTTDDLQQRLERFAAREAGGRAAAQAARAHGDDVRAAAQLVVTATQGVMGVVADMQRAFSPPIVSHITSIVNAAVAGTTAVVGAGVDAALAAVAPLLGASVPGVEREAVLAALNGVVGDRLARVHSPLAIRMSLRPALDERRQGTLLLFVHGSSMNDLQWRVARPVEQFAERAFHDHGRALMNDLSRDVTLAYLHYNTGRHVKHNGDELAALLERESAGFAEIVVVAHSMGGLVARSAVCAAERDGLSWRGRLSTLVTLGTPHNGAPLERIGHIAELVAGATPWTAPLASLGTVRSAGVTDLRFGSVVDVVDDDAARFASTPATTTHAPLPAGVRCCAIAATRSPARAFPDPLPDPLADPLLAGAASLAGDDLVPVPSALGIDLDDPSRTLAFAERHIVHGTSHLGLLASQEVYALLRQWCGP